jgi:hypothetical protein
MIAVWLKLIFYENAVSFYRKNKIGGVRLWYNLLLALFWKKRLVINAHNMHLNFVQLFQDHKYMGQMIKTMIEDMQSNLTPIADVYKRDNKEAQEAIACVEALAQGASASDEMGIPYH